MRQILRSFAAVLVCASLGLAAPGVAEKPVGLVAEAKGCNLVSGTTLFLDTDIWTDSRGIATLLLTKPSGTLLLLGNSRLRLLSSQSTPNVELLEGTLRFLLKQPLRIQARMGTLNIRPENTGLASGQISLLGQNRLSVKAVDAPIAVEVGDEAILVPAGYEYMLELASPLPQGPQGAGKEEAIRERRRDRIIGIFIILGTSATVLIQNGALSDSQKRAFASPFIP